MMVTTLIHNLFQRFRCHVVLISNGKNANTDRTPVLGFGFDDFFNLFLPDICYDI